MNSKYYILLLIMPFIFFFGNPVTFAQDTTKTETGKTESKVKSNGSEIIKSADNGFDSSVEDKIITIKHDQKFGRCVFIDEDGDGINDNINGYVKGQNRHGGWIRPDECLNMTRGYRKRGFDHADTENEQRRHRQGKPNRDGGKD